MVTCDVRVIEECYECVYDYKTLRCYCKLLLI